MSFVMSLCLSVLNNSSHWNEFLGIWYLSIFKKSVENIQVSLKSNRKKRVVYMKTCAHLRYYLAQFFSEGEIFQTNVETVKTHILFWINFSVSRAVYEVMWKNMVEPNRPRMTTV